MAKFIFKIIEIHLNFYEKIKIKGLVEVVGFFSFLSLFVKLQYFIDDFYVR